jgi:hypothetical protein
MAAVSVALAAMVSVALVVAAVSVALAAMVSVALVAVALAPAELKLQTGSIPPYFFFY